MDKLKLSLLQPGERAVIAHIEGDEGVRRRLLAMGLRDGRETRVIRRARFGGPLQVQVGSVQLIVRRRDAAHVLVRRLT